MKLKNYNLIGIAGLKNSGKDTVANMLQYLLGVPSFMRNYTCYRLFKNLNFKKYSIISFAEPLKRTLSALFNIPEKFFNDRNFKENYYFDSTTMKISNIPSKESLNDSRFNRLLNSGDYSFLNNYVISVRQLLQLFGTNTMRNTFGNNVWINLTLNDSENRIISDVRFNNEFNAITSKHGKVIYINRNSCIPGNHISEKEIYELYKKCSFDVVIDNNGSLKDLFNNLKVCI